MKFPELELKENVAVWGRVNEWEFLVLMLAKLPIYHFFMVCYFETRYLWVYLSNTNSEFLSNGLNDDNTVYLWPISWHISSFFQLKLADYTNYAGQFFQKNIKFYVSTFIRIAKLFEIFLKTHPYKLLKNYEYTHT